MTDELEGDQVEPFVAAAPGTRARVLCTVFLVELVLLLWFVRRDPFLLAGIGSALHPAQLTDQNSKELLLNDPAVGSLLPYGEVGEAIRRKGKPARRGCLLVPIGDCAGCIKADLPGWQKQCKARGLSMVLLTTAPEDRSREFLDRLKLTVPFVCDPTEKMERHLNVAWYGRPYLYSTDWHLLWLPRFLSPESPFEDKDFQAALRDASP